MAQHKYKFKENRPVPFELSLWGNGQEIIYKCPSCGMDFRILSDHEKYCHNCGLKLDWTNSPRYCSNEFKEKYHDLVLEHSAILSRASTDLANDYDRELLRLFQDLYFGVIS